MAPLNTPAKMQVSFSDDSVKHMLDLLRLSVLPDKPPIPASDEWKHGISLSYLRKMKKMFESEWSWDNLAAELNHYDNYTVPMGEGTDAFNLHFINARSSRVDAEPLLLLHGWPGSVYEYVKVIDGLTNPPAGRKAFHVVVPSLPGFFLSTHPQREGWTIIDTARVFDQLMVNVLGYPKYFVHGGDWGSFITRILGVYHASTAIAVHLTLLTVFESYDPNGIPMTELEKFGLEMAHEYSTNGNAYLILQKTKPFTIGYTIGASPLSLLAYVGDKYHAWSDPALLDPWSIINTTALYFLSGTSASAAHIYHESVSIVGDQEANPGKWKIRSKFGYTHYKYEISAVPAAKLHEIADDVIYKAEYDKGGHFAALDIPDLFVEDLQKCFGGVLL